MPRLTRWCIKTGLAFFLLALLVGVGAASGWRWFATFRPTLWVTYVHLLTVGWITLLIVGVGYWLFPRYSREQPYGPVPTAVGWAAYGLLAGGVLLRTIAEPILSVTGRAGALIVLSAAMQWLGGMGFIVLLWKRIRTK